MLFRIELFDVFDDFSMATVHAGMLLAPTLYVWMMMKMDASIVLKYCEGMAMMKILMQNSLYVS